MTPQRQMCWRCRRRSPETGYKTCGVCRRELRQRMRAKRKLWRKQGLCSRCGNVKPRPGHTTCAACAKTAAERAAETEENRRIEGLCPRCGRNPVVPGHERCRACIRKQRKAAAKSKRAYDPGAVDRVARLKARRRAKGLCTTCGEPAEINPVTGKPYALCEHHRDKSKRVRHTE